VGANLPHRAGMLFISMRVSRMGLWGLLLESFAVISMLALRLDPAGPR